MNRRRLGTSDLEVSEIALGSWLTYAGGVERERAEACTQAAFEAGINFFDTANVYGQGAAERAWGEILGDYPREEYVLATKLYFPVEGGSGLSAEQVHRQIDASLARLQTDYVDLYQCHRFDVDTPIEETMEALADVVKAGKARWIGFSEWTPEQIEAGLDAAVDGVTFVSSQPQYSMLWQAPEDEVFPLCANRGISQIVWSPLAEGVLSGKYEPGRPPPSDSRAASDEMGIFIKGKLDDRILEAVQRLRPVAEQVGVSMAQLALAWVLRRSEQVHENVAAANVELSLDTLDAIEEALGSVPVTGTMLGPNARGGVLHRRAA